MPARACRRQAEPPRAPEHKWLQPKYTKADEIPFDFQRRRDNDLVTRTICRQVELDVPWLLLGTEVERLSDEDLARAAGEATVFAKLTPDQKARVILALRRGGHVVGFLGDGINDGPALRTADVGISVDTAVDVAKESADIILLEKSLAVLGEGVLEGRKVFGNIVKYIKMGASSNFGNMFSVLARASSCHSCRWRRSRS
jgi:P-type Mg2+ transporter